MVLSRRFFRDDTANVDRDLFGKIEIDIVEQLGVALEHNRVVAVREFERNGIDEMRFLVISERVVEQLRLVIVLLEFLAPNTLLDTFDLLWVSS